MSDTCTSFSPLCGDGVNFLFIYFFTVHFLCNISKRSSQPLGPICHVACLIGFTVSCVLLKILFDKDLEKTFVFCSSLPCLHFSFLLESALGACCPFKIVQTF